MNSHEIDYEIMDGDIQLLEVELDPGETLIAEAGTMNYMEDGITFEVKMGDGSDPHEGIMSKLFKAGKRVLMKEGVFLKHFTNNGVGKRKVSFSAPYPGTILPINLAAFGGRLYCQKDAFLCAALGTQLSIAFSKRFGTGLFGGNGFILQHLIGDGMAFIHAGVTVVKR